MEGKWWFGSSNFYGYCGFWRLLKGEPHKAEQSEVSNIYFLVFSAFRWLNIFDFGVWTSNVCFQLTSSAVDQVAYAGSYGSRTTRFSHDLGSAKPQNARPKLEVKSQYGGKNIKMDFQRRFSHFEAGESALSSRQDSNNFTSSAGHRDLPEIYILVLVSRLCTISSLFDVNLFSHVYPALRQILLPSRLRFSGIRIDLLFYS